MTLTSYGGTDPKRPAARQTISPARHAANGPGIREHVLGFRPALKTQGLQKVGQVKPCGAASSIAPVDEDDSAAAEAHVVAADVVVDQDLPLQLKSVLAERRSVSASANQPPSARSRVVE